MDAPTLVGGVVSVAGIAAVLLAVDQLDLRWDQASETARNEADLRRAVEAVDLRFDDWKDEDRDRRLALLMNELAYLQAKGQISPLNPFEIQRAAQLKLDIERLLRR